MKNKYYLHIQMHNYSSNVEVLADNVEINDGSYVFVKSGCRRIPIAFYPVQHTIIHTIEENN